MDKNYFISFSELIRRLRFLVHLPAYLRNPLTIAEARAILRQRLEQRAQDFLNLIKFAVLDNPISPYRALLQQAGCEYGDIDLLVKKEGLEGGLLELFHAGVYLTMDEYIGLNSPRGSFRKQDVHLALATLAKERESMLAALSRSRDWELAVISNRPAVCKRIVNIGRI